MKNSAAEPAFCHTLGMGLMIAVVALLSLGFAATILGLVGGWFNARRAFASQLRRRESSAVVASEFGRVRDAIQVAEGLDVVMRTALGNVAADAERQIREVAGLPKNEAGSLDPTGESAKLDSAKAVVEGLRWDLAWVGGGLVLTFAGTLLSLMT